MSSRELARVMGSGIVAALVIALVAVGCALQASNALAGTWELASYAYTAGDSTIRGDTAQMRSLKVLTDTHFAWVTVTSDGAGFVGAASGTYEVHDGAYAEVSQYASDPSHRGQTYRFTYRLDGDLWHHTGIVNGVLIEETWRRIR